MLPSLLLLLFACHPTPSDDSGVTVDDTAEDTGEDTGEPPGSEEIRVVGFNTESGDAVANVVAQTIAAVEGESIWGLCEVENAGWASTFSEAAPDGDGPDFEYVLGTTGWSNRLAVLYDPDRFELVDHFELFYIDPDGDGRAPLVARLRSLETGRELLFMVNHLWRSDARLRHEQAGLLHDWAEEQTLPVVAVGDYNFDWEVVGGDTDHDQGYDLMTAGDAWVWVRPEELVATQCSDYYDSVLDFVFVSGEAKSWDGESVILESEPLYCENENEQQSDHRPVEATFHVPTE